MRFFQLLCIVLLLVAGCGHITPEQGAKIATMYNCPSPPKLACTNYNSDQNRPATLSVTMPSDASCQNTNGEWACCEGQICLLVLKKGTNFVSYTPNTQNERLGVWTEVNWKLPVKDWNVHPRKWFVLLKKDATPNYGSTYLDGKIHRGTNCSVNWPSKGEFDPELKETIDAGTLLTVTVEDNDKFFNMPICQIEWTFEGDTRVYFDHFASVPKGTYYSTEPGSTESIVREGCLGWVQCANPHLAP